ncbi:YqaJ viral recombinase family protein [Pseudomonas alliivorans]|uniref:YqaJ viral recombinase family protein n=1 Tax=Pseudomonas alliivorans TaxID=2810613 RepID=UPI001AE56123|nr:YqaJ viral recombinase family protein [Pseudomonas alliivorans]MBP0943119.1 YqaJ viral recombinase family protein [Pseudomonas alliivorans]MEE4881215.1 YqaJ viral recombinase family protein [Pseudomonas alliivorans]MEE4932519.1 YqaJ viral recombinase family protein [Pseudomonas alliivorans]MEE4937982.1 YqaJ viral recombinase family protein [Pseudomonas alliivorans]MEE4943085.1 YqaJ viral recombinase family protein [Pseudomonas alliivorans]
MKTHKVTQGSAEWHALRAHYHTASEAPAMMGASKQMKRTELLQAKKTGLDRDISWWVQKYLFDKGHESEALARPILEARLGEDLFPVVGTEGNLLASLDGCTLLGEIVFEHKTWNEQLAADVRAGELDAHYYWQLEQQLLVSGAEKVIFVCSDGTEENFVSMEYFPVSGRAAKLIAGWKQFEADLEAFEPPESVVEAVGKTPDALPALRIEVTGMVTASNLEQFKAHSLAVFAGINTNLQTDQHFADAEKTVKWCGEVEERLNAAKQHALSQTESIDVLFRTIDDISEQVRRKRLELDKLVKARKLAIREEIVLKAKASFREHLDKINASFGGKARLPEIPADFAGAIKGKKTIASLRDAADSELARAKIEASQAGDSIRANLESLCTLAAEYPFLFSDSQQIVLKNNDDLVSLIKVRINEHKETEAKKEEAQRERIREEEAAKLKEAAEAKRKEAEANAKTVVPVTAATPVEKPATKMTAVPPSAKVPPKPTKLQANVTDLEALVQAVAAGKAPISVLTVNWQNLDHLVDAQGAAFTMPGVTLEQVAA